jgi:copper homeostasis protein (lipoprotein)
MSKRFVNAFPAVLAPAMLAIGLAACSDAKSPAKGGTLSDSVVTVPAVPTITVAAVAPNSFSGTLPCADCSGVQTTVALFTDSTYRLRQQFEGKSTTPVVTMGRWELAGGTLTLRGLTDSLRFTQVSEDTIRLAADAKAVLVRADTMNALRAPVTVVGAFSYMADAPTFRECASGQTYPVLKKGGYAALERAYKAAKLTPGSAQQVELSARFLARPDDLEGPRERDVVEVVKYVGPSANPDCR